MRVAHLCSLAVLVLPSIMAMTIGKPSPSRAVSTASQPLSRFLRSNKASKQMNKQQPKLPIARNTKAKAYYTDIDDMFEDWRQDHDEQAASSSSVHEWNSVQPDEIHKFDSSSGPRPKLFAAAMLSQHDIESEPMMTSDFPEPTSRQVRIVKALIERNPSFLKSMVMWHMPLSSMFSPAINGEQALKKVILPRYLETTRSYRSTDPSAYRLKDAMYGNDIDKLNEAFFKYQYEVTPDEVITSLVFSRSFEVTGELIRRCNWPAPEDDFLYVEKDVIRIINEFMAMFEYTQSGPANYQALEDWNEKIIRMIQKLQTPEYIQTNLLDALMYATKTTNYFKTDMPPKSTKQVKPRLADLDDFEVFFDSETEMTPTVNLYWPQTEQKPPTEAMKLAVLKACYYLNTLNKDIPGASMDLPNDGPSFNCDFATEISKVPMTDFYLPELLGRQLAYKVLTELFANGDRDLSLEESRQVQTFVEFRAYIQYLEEQGQKFGVKDAALWIMKLATEEQGNLLGHVLFFSIKEDYDAWLYKFNFDEGEMKMMPSVADYTQFRKLLDHLMVKEELGL